MGRAHEVRAKSMAATAAMKSAKYAKWGKEIYSQAKAGVPDPEMNPSLKRIIERAKKDQVPADVIKRALEKAKGFKSGNFSEVRYEGFGPGNVSVVVDCLTDNVNRTVSNVRAAFTKTGGKLGVTGSVIHMFSRKAIVSLENFSEEEAFDVLLGADLDVEIEVEDGVTTITGEPNLLDSIIDAITAAKGEVEFIENNVDYIASQYVTLDEEHLPKFERFMGMLEEDEDVQEVFHNADNY